MDVRLTPQQRNIQKTDGGPSTLRCNWTVIIEEEKRRLSTEKILLLLFSTHFKATSYKNKIYVKCSCISCEQKE